MDDFELLEAWSSGDRAAARTLFERHFDAVYRFFAGKISEGIEDLVQDTFVACMEARTRFRGAASFRAFMLGTARNLLFNAYRRRGSAPALAEIGESRLGDLDPSPSAIVVRRQEERLLLEALRRIPLDHQIAIELYEWEGLRAVDVAEVLGVSEAAVRSRVHRAKQALRDELAQLANSKQLLQSTIDGLEGWAQALRERLGR